MFASDSGRFVISNLGWVDGGALAIYDADTGTARSAAVEPSATHLALIPGIGDCFAVLRESSAGSIISVHHSTAPHESLASVALRDGKPHAHGDPAAWDRVPHVYRATSPAFARGDVPGYCLMSITPDAREARPLKWFTDPPLDSMYQGALGAIDLGAGLVGVAVQRSGRLFLHDWERGDLRGELELPGRHAGNPTARYRTPDELWVDNYDTLAVFDPRTLELLRHRDLRADRPPGHFIGAWSFDRSRTRCAVPRPGDGDVLILDAELAITHRAEVDGEPLEAAFLSDGRIITRGWQSGEWTITTPVAVSQRLL